MMLNESMSSSSRWRIPSPTIQPQEHPRAGFASEWKLRFATARRSGAGFASTAEACARGLSSALFLALLVGGVFVAPAMALLALASLFTSLQVVREVAPTLIGVSLVWLTIAILGAHVRPERVTRVGAPGTSLDPQK